MCQTTISLINNDESWSKRQIKNVNFQDMSLSKILQNLEAKKSIKTSKSVTELIFIKNYHLFTNEKYKNFTPLYRQAM